MSLSRNNILTPAEVASLWQEDTGFVWLDSSSEEVGEISLLGHHPDLILQGDSSEWHLLAEELERRKSPFSKSDTKGRAEGAAMGYFRFDGSFCFGFYDSPLLHNSRGWRGTPPAFAELKRAPVALDPPPIGFFPNIERTQYLRMIEQAQEYIASGDIYQVCLAHRFTALLDTNASPFSLYLALRKASPAPHAAYLHLNEESILSSSPECFLKMSGRHILTRPIKGTRPRMQTQAEDARQALELTTSPKEIAELIMITDLERNDLGQVCDYGSVTTTQLLHLERYAQVFHLVSTVEGELRKGVSQVEALAACFPGGSISGSPKKRALEIIRELEPVPRGLFTGAIGYFGYNGVSQFNIAIRTVVIRNDESGDKIAEFHVGAGITADSDPASEWKETLHKAAGILQAARGGRDS